MKLIKKNIPNFLILFILERRYIFSEINKKHGKSIKKIIDKNVNSLSIDNEKKWIKKLNKLTYAFPDLYDVAESFASAEIKILKNVEVKQNDLIAICIAKNDLIKIKKFITYHRNLGIDKFVILDNDSTDGSVEWLSNQDDVIVMQTKMPYTTNRREGWINRIIAHYGDERWYFVADSDELLDYNNSENMTIKDVINFYKKNNIIRGRALMLDMYATAPYYSKGKLENFYEECKFFDKDTYYSSPRKYIDLVCGGPRERIFNEAPWLTKYPLFYFRKQDVECKSHFLFPFKENLNSECNIVLKHYKFQPGEYEKYKKIAESGNYFKGSRQYKNYVKVWENMKELNFLCDSTFEYKNSNSLDEINVYKKINWDIGDK